MRKSDVAPSNYTLSILIKLLGRSAYTCGANFGAVEKDFVEMIDMLERCVGEIVSRQNDLDVLTFNLTFTKRADATSLLQTSQGRSCSQGVCSLLQLLWVA